MSESSQTYSIPPLFFLAILLKSTFSHNGITALEWDRGQGSARYAHSRSQHYEQDINVLGHQHSVAWKSQLCTHRLLEVWLACEILSMMKAFVRLVGGGFFFNLWLRKKNKTELYHSWWYVVLDKGTSIAANPLRRFQPQWSVMQRTDDYKDLPGPCAVCSLPGTITVNNTVLYSTTEHWL